MHFSAPPSPATGPYDDLLLQFAALYRDVQRASECADVRLSDLAGGRRYSLENLHAYLALRAHDLRPCSKISSGWAWPHSNTRNHTYWQPCERS